MRLIDGDKLMMHLTDWWYSSFGQEETDESKAIKSVMDKIEQSLGEFALEKQDWDRWHSVLKEGNPKESGAYNCTCSDGTPVRRVTAIKYIKGTNEWAMTGRRTFWKVIAWRPLPEPYTEEEA